MITRERMIEGLRRVDEKLHRRTLPVFAALEEIGQTNMTVESAHNLFSLVDLPVTDEYSADYTYQPFFSLKYRGTNMISRRLAEDLDTLRAQELIETETSRESSQTHSETVLRLTPRGREIASGLGEKWPEEASRVKAQVKEIIRNAAPLKDEDMDSSLASMAYNNYLKNL